MPRKPKAKNTLSAGERAALYEAELAEKRALLNPNPRVSEESAEKNIATEKKEEKGKPELQKPQYATVKVDLSMTTGTIKPLHSMCNGPVSYGADISSLFSEIGVPFVRFDETDTAISAYAVDVSRIFKDMSKDPQDSGNYDFAYTDRYVAAAHNAGARVIFRLGESIDRMHSGKHAALPDDIDTYVDVCANIVRHYNDYWADGFAYGIEYFEILAHGQADQNEQSRAFELYRRIASAVKLIGNGAKVGGMCFSDMSAVRDFLRICKKTRAPLDFLTLSSFDSDPHSFNERLRDLVPLLHNLGFYETEIIIGAWGYIDEAAVKGMSIDRILSSSEPKYTEARRALFEAQRSVKGAAYALAFMISAAKIKEVSMACFYDAQPNISPWCAISDRFGNPEKPFFAFKAYGQLFRAGRELYTLCDEQDGFAHPGIYAVAAESADAAYILLSSFDGCGTVDLRLEGIPSDTYTAEIYMLDGVKDMSLADSVPLSGDKKRLILNISRYGAAMVKLY